MNYFVNKYCDRTLEVYDHNLTNTLAFIQDFTAGRVGQVKGHVSLEMLWKYLTNGIDY